MGDFNEYPSSSGIVGPQGPQGPVGPQGPAGSLVDTFQQDVFTWAGSQTVLNGVFQNYFALPGVAKEPNGTAGLLLSSGVILFPPKLRLSQVIFSVRITGTIGGTSGVIREWLTQTRRPEGTLVGSTAGVKLSGNDISSRDSVLVSFTKGPLDPFTVNGAQVGISNISTQTITLTSVSVRVQRIINPDPEDPE